MSSCHPIVSPCHPVNHCITTSLSRMSTISFSLWGCMVLPTRASLFHWIRKRTTAPNRPGQDRETRAHWYLQWTHRYVHMQKDPVTIPHMVTLKKVTDIYAYAHTTHACTHTNAQCNRNGAGAHRILEHIACEVGQQDAGGGLEHPSHCCTASISTTTALGSYRSLGVRGGGGSGMHRGT